MQKSNWPILTNDRIDRTQEYLTVGIYFEIQADEFDRAKRFYVDVFGWKFTKADGTPVEYWRIETGDGDRGGSTVEAG